ncbi:UDP-2,3-diacylglucosamine diphosphatase [candidate division WOR-3 bacterium]|nr:UDP-2,3-diacylglucosamine diphosphatase [candidate division WOR-3 bacterium]
MHVFISDAHIRTDRSSRGQLLVRFLREMRHRLTNLYILGDLFEFWFEYNRAFPKYYFTLLATLYNIVQDGKGVHYVMGNHEVTMGGFLAGLGFKVHRGPTIFEIDGRRVLVEHGHKIDRRPWTVLWENLLTSKVNHAVYRLLHPDAGIILAQRIAHLSRKQHQSTRLECMLEDYARDKLQDEDVDVVILGHSHTPVFRRLPDNKYYINAGDWINHFSYVVIDGNTTALKYYGPHDRP